MNTPTKSEIMHLNQAITDKLKYSEMVVLATECRKHGIVSIDAVEVLKYIDPRVRTTARVPVEYVNWLVDTKLTDKSKKEKQIEGLKPSEKDKYRKYRIGREIRVRTRYKNKPKAYQDLRLQNIYVAGLHKYLVDKGL
ncbi:MAG: hypothetical protein ACK5LC_00310 [Coprobacillaceae bacterium]